jgi:uncharacterized membrane protein YuzA (DUF378 family)
MRTILAYLILFCGLAVGFAAFFGVILLAAVFLGIGWAAAAFAVQIAGIAATLCVLFSGERIPEDDDAWCGGAVEGANVYALPVKGRAT